MKKQESGGRTQKAVIHEKENARRKTHQRGSKPDEMDANLVREKHGLSSSQKTKGRHEQKKRMGMQS